MTRSAVAVVAALGNLDLQPAAGFDYEVRDVGSSAFVGVPPNAVPEVNVGIFNGVIGPSFVLQSTDIRGWNREQSLHLNNGNYLRLTNPNAGLARNISYAAQVARAYGNGVSRAVTTLQTVAAGANWDIIPTAGEEWLVKDVGASVWVGGAPANLPDCTVSLFDGANAAAFMMGANARGWGKPLDLHIDATNYLRLTNTNAAPNVLSVSGVVSRARGTAATAVRSDVQAIAAGANWDVQPAAGEEWLITDFGSGTWVGVAPAALPQITVSLFDGVNASIVLISTDVKGWLDPIAIQIDNTTYLRINDASGAGQNICFSGVLVRTY
jgi:hypothetical protein